VSFLEGVRDRRRLRRAQGAAPSLVASVAPGAIAKVEGVIEADATIVAPITGRVCVAWELRVDHRDDVGDLVELEPGHGDRVPFWIVDAEGGRARVEDGPAILRMLVQDVTTHRGVAEDNAALAAFLRERGLVRGARDHVYWEAVLAPGERAWAYGALREAPEVVQSGYRDASIAVRVFVGTPKDPVVLYGI
jgi:hypothetical protein